ncbi:MAG: DNA repair protein RecO [Oscillospiraceae bacterium]|nr:DNA repair protein RecO [Oscillospiraceae bacterium]
MRIQTEALVLFSSETGENDRLITVLSKEHGVLRAFANHARKPSSRLQSASQPFCRGTYEFSQRKDAWTVTEARPKELFFGLAADPARLALAVYLADLARELSPREEPAPEQLRLMLNVLHFLASGRRPQPLLKAVAELRLMCLAGYAPSLEASGGTPYYFDCLAGKLTPQPNRRTMELSPGVLEALRFLCAVPLERAFHFTMPDHALRELSGVTQRYIIEQMGRQFESLRYYEKLLV